MSLWHMAWGYLWNRKLPTCLTIASVALAVGLISSVLTLREETQKRFEEEGQLFDIVVGAKGSRLQLVLSAVFFMDNPTGNIVLSDYERLQAHEDVANAFPISLGDTYQEFRIAGTTPDLFAYELGSTPSQASRAIHSRWQRIMFFEKPMEALLGSTVARKTGLKVNDTFIGTHGFMRLPEGSTLAEDIGLVHDDAPYTVAGILKPSGSPADRVVFCDLASVWEVHGHDDELEDDDAHEYHGPFRADVHPEDTTEDHPEEAHEDGQREITAVLIDLVSPALRFQFEEYVEAEYNAMAARPVSQIATLYRQLLGTAKMVLLTIGYLVVVISALSILIGLYLSILQRRRDLAIMRALGASSYEVLGAVLIEALLVTVLGIGAGWVLGGLVTAGIGLFLAQRFGLYVQAFGLSTDQLVAFGTVALMGLVAGILPAWQAYRTDVARDLSHT